jgi:hypothetical protein
MHAALQSVGAGVRPTGTEQDNWQPYEGLDWYAQDRTLQAAAAVIAALQHGTITGHGTAAHLFRPHYRQPGMTFANPLLTNLQRTSEKDTVHWLPL